MTIKAVKCSLARTNKIQAANHFTPAMNSTCLVNRHQNAAIHRALFLATYRYDR